MSLSSVHPGPAPVAESSTGAVCAIRCARGRYSGRGWASARSLRAPGRLCHRRSPASGDQPLAATRAGCSPASRASSARATAVPNVPMPSGSPAVPRFAGKRWLTATNWASVRAGCNQLIPLQVGLCPRQRLHHPARRPRAARADAAWPCSSARAIRSTASAAESCTLSAGTIFGGWLEKAPRGCAQCLGAYLRRRRQVALAQIRDRHYFQTCVGAQILHQRLEVLQRQAVAGLGMQLGMR